MQPATTHSTTSATSHGNIYIGTSNIVLPGAKKTFPPAFQAGSRLAYYASLFNTVEINSSFYKVPLPATFEKWSDEVPDDFRFSVKLWRNITHARSLAFNTDDIDFFMSAASRLRKLKKGCLLVQLPASITITTISKIEQLLQRLQQSDPVQEWRRCIEFRHNSWYTAEVYAMLDHYQASLVLHDIPASRLQELQTRAGWVYLRFHGVKGDYRGGYPDAILQRHATAIQQWQQQGKEVYVYFNNTMGDAFANAQTLQKMTAAQKR